MTFINLLKQRIDEQDANLPKEVRDRLLAFNELDSKHYQFQIIKKSKAQPCEGDIFYHLSSPSRYLTKNILSSIVKIRKLFYFGLNFSVKS
ncbi:hypothetical protein RFK55_09150, partial [Streptococcus suis]